MMCIIIAARKESISPFFTSWECWTWNALIITHGVTIYNTPVYIHSPAGLTDISVDYLESMLFISGCQNIYKSPAAKMTHHYIQTLDKGNIFIFISSSGKFESTLNLAKEAKLHGMIVISISSIENNDLAEISNYNIRFFSKAPLLQMGGNHSLIYYV